MKDLDLNQNQCRFTNRFSCLHSVSGRNMALILNINTDTQERQKVDLRQQLRSQVSDSSVRWKGDTFLTQIYILKALAQR